MPGVPAHARVRVVLGARMERTPVLTLGGMTGSRVVLETGAEED